MILVKKIILIVLFIVFSSFNGTTDTEMYGEWMLIEKNIGNELHYKKVKKVRKNSFGFSIRENNQAIIYTNSFGCLLIKKNGKRVRFIDKVEGEWIKVDDSKIKLRYEVFGGIIEKELIWQDKVFKEKINRYSPISVALRIFKSLHFFD